MSRMFRRQSQYQDEFFPEIYVSAKAMPAGKLSAKQTERQGRRRTPPHAAARITYTPRMSREFLLT